MVMPQNIAFLATRSREKRAREYGENMIPTHGAGQETAHAREKMSVRNTHFPGKNARLFVYAIFTIFIQISHMFSLTFSRCCLRVFHGTCGA